MQPIIKSDITQNLNAAGIWIDQTVTWVWKHQNRVAQLKLAQQEQDSSNQRSGYKPVLNTATRHRDTVETRHCQN